jgi:methylated-DNA-[protein]-cysteine S-methyltransferase
MTSQIESDGGEHYCLFDTALGACGVAWSAEGITRLQLPQANRDAAARRLRRWGARESDAPPPSVRQTIADIERYCAGERIDFSGVSLDLVRADAFEQRVYAAARAVGWGCITTYGALARELGTADAREIGQALSRNPIPLIVPCHRVLAKDAVGGFSAYGGTAAKERLLALEGVRPAKQLPLAFMQP